MRYAAVMGNAPGFLVMGRCLSWVGVTVCFLGVIFIVDVSKIGTKSCLRWSLDRCRLDGLNFGMPSLQQTGEWDQFKSFFRYVLKNSFLQFYPSYWVWNPQLTSLLWLMILSCSGLTLLLIPVLNLRSCYNWAGVMGKWSYKACSWFGFEAVLPFYKQLIIWKINLISPLVLNWLSLLTFNFIKKIEFGFNQYQRKSCPKNKC